MIVLDTHIWVWWNQDSPQLTNVQKEIIENSRSDGIEYQPHPPHSPLPPLPTPPTLPTLPTLPTNL